MIIFKGIEPMSEYNIIKDAINYGYSHYPELMPKSNDSTSNQYLKLKHNLNDIINIYFKDNRRSFFII